MKHKCEASHLDLLAWHTSDHKPREQLPPTNTVPPIHVTTWSFGLCM